MDSQVVIEKLVHGGQGLGTLQDGRKVFVWNALPGETVSVRLIKSKKDYAEAIAEEVVKPSAERIEPHEHNFLATSPWQMMTYAAENKYKAQIIQEIFSREHITLPDFEFKAPQQEWRYRNKMEYSFWGDDDGLHLALHQRGSRGKQIVQGSELAMSAIDTAANDVLAELQKLNIRAGDLKSLVVRCNQNGETVVGLFTKLEDFPELNLPKTVKGMRVYHSSPRSPAAVPTRLIREVGDPNLQDAILGNTLGYDVDSFFQVNIPIFEEALTTIKQYVNDNSVVDMYGGVGSIGLTVSSAPVIIELDTATANMAQQNAAGTSAEVIHASSEKALDHIVGNRILIVDPPRAGLHKDVVARVNEAKPPQVVYLSCNPATQARDLALLADEYEITFFEGYNFFPRTPHIETLAILQRK